MANKEFKKLRLCGLLRRSVDWRTSRVFQSIKKEFGPVPRVTKRLIEKLIKLHGKVFSSEDIDLLRKTARTIEDENKFPRSSQDCRCCECTLARIHRHLRTLG